MSSRVHELQNGEKSRKLLLHGTAFLKWWFCTVSEAERVLKVSKAEWVKAKKPPHFLKVSSFIYMCSSISPNELHTDVSISISQRNKIIIRTVNIESLINCTASGLQLNIAKTQQIGMIIKMHSSEHTDGKHRGQRAVKSDFLLSGSKRMVSK